MKITFISSDKASAGVSVVPVFAKRAIFGAVKGFQKGSKGNVSAAMKAASFSGEAGESVSLYALAEPAISHLELRGAGERDGFDAELFAAKAVQAHRTNGEKTLTLYLDGMGLDPAEAARAAVGARLAGYHFFKYRTKLAPFKETTITAIRIVSDDPVKTRAAYKNLYGPICDGQLLARDLVNEPANILHPEAYTARIKELAKLGLNIEVLGEKKMLSLGMGALVGVGQGSPRESQLVIMKWNGGKKGDPPVCLVGKGITFDTGGISLKPVAGMWDMKGDMGGSAAVVGTMQALASRKAKVNVIGVVALAENMPDGRAQKPGDVVTSMSGQTIELQSTDAEGRLVLADALWYSKEKFKPRAMVDLATLTGAVLVTFGHEYAGLFSNSDPLAKAFEKASSNSSEKTWRLPLAQEYDRLIDSPTADMKNSVGRGAGSITAAQFLKRFVGDTPWVHLDIAGTSSKNERTDPRETTLAIGFGVRLLSHWIHENYEG